jgi:hypothetical protein
LQGNLHQLKELELSLLSLLVTTLLASRSQRNGGLSIRDDFKGTSIPSISQPLGDCVAGFSLLVNPLKPEKGGNLTIN